MKIRAAGWTIIYEPAAALYHFESRSRVATIRPEEIELIQAALADPPRRRPVHARAGVSVTP